MRQGLSTGLGNGVVGDIDANNGVEPRVTGPFGAFDRRPTQKLMEEQEAHERGREVAVRVREGPD